MTWAYCGGGAGDDGGGLGRKSGLGNGVEVRLGGGVGGIGEAGTGMGVSVGGGGTVEGLLCMKVMTDEQMEVLRKQISVYATICEQLVEMHRAITARQDSIAEMRLGSVYCDPLGASGGHKITSRQRWTPTPTQLQILEGIFDKGIGTPSKQKIKEITSALASHGQISETNVYNWFQNRRARSKRKQTVEGSKNAESEVETEIDSTKEKKGKADRFGALKGSSLLNGPASSPGSFGRTSFYDSVVGNSRGDQTMGRMETSASYRPFGCGGSGYDMAG
ncbi:unnamed protein product [Spirodela intermedia]|uniref:Homeobox domain-containing protein n=1 Tax=Spirodela intermedia TaxID=51605 RepID=A0A7I8K2Y7_SPIIN|nr:unnamed protein product [Spirodela intermedia]